MIDLYLSSLHFDKTLDLFMKHVLTELWPCNRRNWYDNRFFVIKIINYLLQILTNPTQHSRSKLPSSNLLLFKKIKYSNRHYPRWGLVSFEHGQYFIYAFSSHFCSHHSSSILSKQGCILQLAFWAKHYIEIYLASLFGKFMRR